MKKLTCVIAVTACLAVVLIGCSPTSPAPVAEPEPPAVDTTPPEAVPEPEPPEVEATPGNLTFAATPDVESKLADVNWISPGKVTIGNLYPGARAEYPITIHNGGDAEASFAVAVREPDYVADGYEPLPEEYHGWITISDSNPVIGPKQSLDVMITVTLPSDISYPGKNVEVWVSVMEQGQEGMIRTELASRWLISTK